MSTTRIKPGATVVATMDQAKAAMAELASCKRSLDRIELEKNTAIDATKTQKEAEAAPYRERSKELAAALQGYATANKAELFRVRRSVELPHGVLGYRLVSSIVAKSKVKMDAVIEKLKDLGWLEGVKSEEKVNKAAMAKWSPERLDQVGLRRKVVDEFYIEISNDDSMIG